MQAPTVRISRVGIIRGLIAQDTGFAGANARARSQRDAHQSNTGTNVRLAPVAIVKSAPPLQLMSFTRNLKAKVAPDSPVTRACQISRPMQVISMPESQLRPGPSPRTKSEFPNPTSTLAVIVVVAGVMVTALTAMTPLAGAVDVSSVMGAGTGAAARAIVATILAVAAASVCGDGLLDGFAADFVAGLADLVAGAGDLVDLVVFLVLLMCVFEGFLLTPIRRRH